jgi:hypothetical protein
LQRFSANNLNNFGEQCGAIQHRNILLDFCGLGSRSLSRLASKAGGLDGK